MSRLLTIIITIIFLQTAAAQDKHFTQFYASPLNLNPALTGAFNGKYRAGIIYRDQWRGVLDAPFRTFSAGLEVKFPMANLMKVKTSYKDQVAVGLTFFSDKVSGVDFNTTQIALSGAYHKALDVENRHYLTIGFQGGLYQRNVNYEDFTFQDQFNGLDGYTLATDEELPANNFSYGDIGVGLNYTFAISRFSSIFLGGAFHHVGRPQLSFYANDDNDLTASTSQLYQKISGQFSAHLHLNNQIALIPRALFALQGPHMEINAGTNVRISMSEYNGTALYIGGWARPVKFEDNSMQLDAIVALLGLEYNGMLIGLSYDINFSDLTTYQQGQGAFELSISYIGEYDSETILCPKF